MAKSRALFLNAGVLALLVIVCAPSASADEQASCPVNTHPSICQEKKCTSDSECRYRKCCQQPSCGGRCTLACREKCADNHVCTFLPGRSCISSKVSMSCYARARCISKLCLDKTCPSGQRCRVQDGRGVCIPDDYQAPGVCQKPHCPFGDLNKMYVVPSCLADAECYRQGEKCCKIGCKRHRCVPACESQCPAGQECKWTMVKAPGEKPQQKAVCTPLMDTKDRKTVEMLHEKIPK